VSAPLALFLVAAAAAPQPPTVVIGRFVGEGMSERDLDSARARVEEELVLMGAAHEPATEPPAPECFDDHACVASVAGARAGVLEVTLTRVGPLLQVNARLFARDGVLLFAADRSVNAEGIAGTGSLLGTEFAPHIRGLAAPEPEPEPTDETPPPDDGGAASAGGPDFMLLVSGGALAVVGVGMAAVGGAIAAQQTAVAYTPSTPGDEKAGALVLAPTMAVIGAVGAIAAIGGIGLVGAAFLLE
jgi:hypothetical protein